MSERTDSSIAQQLAERPALKPACLHDGLRMLCPSPNCDVEPIVFFLLTTEERAQAESPWSRLPASVCLLSGTAGLNRRASGRPVFCFSSPAACQRPWHAPCPAEKPSCGAPSCAQGRTSRCRTSNSHRTAGCRNSRRPRRDRRRYAP